MSRFLRQKDILPLSALDRKITVVGAGGVGSRAVEALVALGFSNLTVYDYDSVDEVNVGPQAYWPKHIGMKKVEALAHLVKETSGFSIKPRHGKFTEFSDVDHVCVSAVDSMASRYLVFEAVRARGRYLLDVRMGAEELTYLCADFRDESELVDYEKSLFPDEQGDRDPCTARAIAYTTFVAGALIAKGVKDICMGSVRMKRASMHLGRHDYASVWTKAPKEAI